MSYTKHIDELDSNELESVVNWSFDHMQLSSRDEYDWLLEDMKERMNENSNFVSFQDIEFDRYGYVDNVVYWFGSKFWDVFDNLPGNQVKYEMQYYPDEIKSQLDVNDFTNEFDNLLIMIFGPDGELDTTYSELNDLITKGIEYDYSLETIERAIGKENIQEFMTRFTALRNSCIAEFDQSSNKLGDLINYLRDFSDGGNAYVDWLKSDLEGYEITFDDDGEVEDIDYY